MLLRRVIQHVKAQNWTAVALDFVIVVVGVFIGIQVSNWNDSRRARVQEKDYMQRLHDEAKAGLDGLLGWLSSYSEPRYRGFQDVVTLLSDPGAEELSLSNDQCDIIGNMHDFIALPSQFPSLAEMTASGEFDLIRDAELRRALINYRMMKDQSQVLIENLNTSLTILPNVYPDYFEARIVNDAPGRELTYRNCDVQAMAADQAFLNQFADVASRYNQYYNIVVDQEKIRVTHLHALLDKKLGISHDQAN